VNSLKSPLRRAAAIIAGSIVGLAGVVAVASPSVAPRNAFAISCRARAATAPAAVGRDLDGHQQHELRRLDRRRGHRPSPRREHVVRPRRGHRVPAVTDGALVGKQTIDNDNPAAKISVRVGWGDPANPTVTSSPSRRPSPSGPTPGEPVRDRLAEPVAERDLRLPVAEPERDQRVAVAVAERDLRLAVASTTSASPSRATSTPPASESAGWFYDETCDHDHGRRRRPGLLERPDGHLHAEHRYGQDDHRSGRQGDQRRLPGLRGLSVTATGRATRTRPSTIKYKAPSDCDGGGLPVTGAAAGGIAAGAVALLAVGGFLFFMARRRKVKFTA